MIRYGQILVYFLLQTLFWSSQVTASSDTNADLKLDEFKTGLNWISNGLKDLKTELTGQMRDSVNNIQKKLNVLLNDQFPELANLYSQCEENQVTVAPPVTSECYRGMPQTSRRLRFLLWGKIPALCDTQTDGGGWIIILRRTKGDTSFDRNWQDYKYGFGTPETDYWLGNENIHNLTLNGYTNLRVDTDFERVNYYANYGYFRVGDEFSRYKLSVGDYSGTAGDGLGYHDDMMFSTPDRDNDLYSGHCASSWKSGWWFNSCYGSLPSGKWKLDANGGVHWYGIDKNKSLWDIEIKVRLA